MVRGWFRRLPPDEYWVMISSLLVAYPEAGMIPVIFEAVFSLMRVTATSPLERFFYCER